MDLCEIPERLTRGKNIEITTDIHGQKSDFGRADSWNL